MMSPLSFGSRNPVCFWPWLLKSPIYLCWLPWFLLYLLTPSLYQKRMWGGSQSRMDYKKRGVGLKQQGKDRNQDACDICVIQTLKHTHILGNHMLATHCVQGLGARMGGRDCSSPCFCWFSAKNEGLYEMVTPKLPFSKKVSNKSKVV